MRFRLATLAVAFVAASLARAQESAPTTVDARTIEGVSDLEVTARGDAEIRRDDVTIFGDYLRYNQEFGRVDAEGGVRLESGPDHFSGPSLHYDTRENTGEIERPSFYLERELPARGSAERLEFLGKDRYRLHDVRYTTCKPGQDDWFLEASRLDLDYERQEGHADAPRLRFFDRTILAFPFASFPLESSRKSGFLTPYYSTTSTRGFEVGIPYYWNIAPERDATFTPVYMARRGAQLKSEFRYLGHTYGGELKYEYLPDDPIFGSTRTGTSWQHRQNLLPNLTAQLDYNRVSDDRYFVDLASQVKQVSVGNLPQDAYLTHGLALPYGGSLTSQVRVQKFQTLQDPLAPIVPPYHRVPQVNVSAAYADVAGLADASLPLEYVRFEHPTLVQGNRTSATPTLALPILTPGWFLTPKVGLRAMAYDLDRPVPGSATTTPHAAIPWLSVDTGLTLERPSSLYGEQGTQTLEPRLFYVYVPFRDQDDMPLFDTTLADFNYPQLFSENRFVGGDRFGDANQLTAALTSRFLYADGHEGLRATIGQRYYFSDERVALTPGTSLRRSNRSDILASLGGRFRTRWTFDLTGQYDPQSHRVSRYGAAARYSPGPTRVLNLSYRYQRDVLRQVDISGQWPIGGGWYGVGRYNYSFLDQRLLEGLVGAEYNAGCWVFRAVVQRVQAAANVASTALVFQLEFTGVGQIGTAEAVSLLSRHVPGYSTVNRAGAALAPGSDGSF
ncbi:MAG TPA: LPS-assembly protein LptD [Burkholderiales bacterium]